MGFDVIIGMHTLAMFVLYFFNLVCLVGLHWLIKDKPFLHWRDQYSREARIVATVSTLYSFKATRILYSNLLAKPYFNAVFEDRVRSLIRPFFIISMAAQVQAAIILMANVYTIW